MQTRTFLISVIFGWIGVGHLPAMAEQQPVYRLAQTWPQLPQPWNFGQLNHIALTPEGDLWVQDASNNRLQKLQASTGKVLKQLSLGPGYSGNVSNTPGLTVATDGSLWEISTQGQLLHLNTDGSLIAEVLPEGAVLSGVDLHVAKDGSFWFVDTNSTISHYDPTLNSIAQFKNDCSDLSLFKPSNAVIASDGSYWLLDNAPPKINHFNTNGSLIQTIPVESNQTPYLSALALAVDGTIWVSDGNNQRVQHFKVDGSLIGQFGSQGDAPGQFNNPGAIAIAKDGSLWVVDTGNNRLQHFKADGVFIDQVGSQGTAAGQFQYPGYLTIAADGSLWVTDYQRVQHFSAKGEYIGQMSNPKQLSDFGKVTISPDDTLWVIGSNAVSNSFSRYALHFKADGSVLGELGGVEQVSRPEDFVFAGDGSIWVRDVATQVLHHFTAKGEFIEAITYLDAGSWDKSNCRSTRPGQFNTPQAVASMSDGSIWVADTGNNRLQHLTAQGKVIAVIGSKGTTSGLFQQPVAVAVAVDGSVWVVDQGNDRLQHFNAEGNFIAQIGGNGTKAGQFLQPSDMAIANDGSMWVVDTGNRRIQNFTAAGAFIKQYGRLNNDSTLEKIFDQPTGLAVDPDGSLWVGNGNNSALLHLDATGKMIEQIGAPSFSESQNFITDNASGKFFPVPYVKRPATDGSIWQLDPKNALLMQRVNAEGQVLATVLNVKESENDSHTINRLETLKDGRVWSLHSRWAYSSRGFPYAIYWLEQHTASGVFVSKITTQESPALVGNFDFAPADDGSLWVTTVMDRKILHLDVSGKTIEHFDVPDPHGMLYNYLGSIVIDSTGALWIADPVNHRIVKFVPKARSSAAADYDDNHQILYLDDVVVDDVHYQATLQYQAGAFNLSSFSPTTNIYTSPGVFDRATDYLTLPLVRAMGQSYQAGFKHLGNQVFELHTLSPQ